MEDDIRKFTDKENLNPNMLKCINCGEPAEFYVNNNRVCSDTVCVNAYCRVEYNNLLYLIKTAESRFSRLVAEYRELPRRPCRFAPLWERNEWAKSEKQLATAINNTERRLNELIEEQTKRYQEYLQEE